MTVWVLILDNSLYSIGYRGGRPGYLTKKHAEDLADVLRKDKSEGKYIRLRGGVKVCPITADRCVLEALKIFPYEEEK